MLTERSSDTKWRGISPRRLFNKSTPQYLILNSYLKIRALSIMITFINKGTFLHSFIKELEQISQFNN